MDGPLTLLEAYVSLWPEMAGGSADLNNPIWSNAFAHQLRMDQVPIAVTTQPTGAAIPRRRVLAVSHSIALAQVFMSATGALPTPLPLGRMVLQVHWIPEDANGLGQNAWMRRVFKGVTVEASGQGERDGMEFMEEVRLMAESMTQANGTGTIPSPT